MKLSNVYLSLFVVVPAVVVADTGHKNQLDAIHVTVLRDGNEQAKAVNNVSEVNKLQLNQQQATSVAEALNKLTNVDSQGGSRSLAQKPNIRGLSGNRVVQVVDGVRQNFDQGHRGSYFVPTSLIQQIEVVKGPSTTLWGSGALGGVVAIRTANALDFLKSGKNIGAFIRQGYQSANSLSESEAAVFAANDKFDFLIQGAYTNAKDLRIGEGEKLPYSAYKQTGGQIKFGWQLNEEHRLELLHRLSINKQTVPSNNENRTGITSNQQFSDLANQVLTSSTRNYNSLGGLAYLVDQKLTSKNTALNYYVNPEHNPYINSQFTIYHSSTNNQETRVSQLQDRTKFTTIGFNLRNSSELNKISLTYGVDYYQDKVDAIRGRNDSDGKYRPNSYDGKAKVTGAYLLANIPIGEQFIISPSLRYDNYVNDGKYKSSQNNWSPSLALHWKATSWLDLTARYSTAFRAPSLQEQYASGSHFGGDITTFIRGQRATIPFVNTIIENPDLKAEKAKNAEVTAKLHFDNVLTQADKLTFNATYFQNNIKDFINFFVGVNSQTRSLYSQYQNVPNARLKGFELSTNYQINDLDLALGYSQTTGKNKDDGTHLSNIAAKKFTFAVDYALVKDKFSVGANLSRYMSQKKVPSSYNPYPGYTLAGIHASYAPKQGEWENLRIDFAIDNLFDKKYTQAFSLTESGGRNVKLSVGYAF